MKCVRLKSSQQLFFPSTFILHSNRQQTRTNTATQSAGTLLDHCAFSSHCPRTHLNHKVHLSVQSSMGKVDADGVPEGAWRLSAFCAMVPIVGCGIAHQRGLTVKIFTAAYNTFGVAGIFGLPFCTLAFEKSVYDTANSYQGKVMHLLAHTHAHPPRERESVCVCVLFSLTDPPHSLTHTHARTHAQPEGPECRPQRLRE
jgi:hypothetical protein